MVGEIRDLETAEVAINAAQTGHLVFSTLHTNDAPGAVTRLIDMGVEPFLVASSLEAVIAQRLVRVICPKCKKSIKPPKEILEWLGLSTNQEYTFYKGIGCKECGRSGYKGRTGIFEVMEISDRLRNLIVSKVSSSALRNAAIEEGLKTLLSEGIKKILAGITTVEEVMRVSKESEK
jgi:type II secretory ATPase GspE/PulE/Tfp pilus assembly ATPase PilB-like protein